MGASEDGEKVFEDRRIGGIEVALGFGPKQGVR